MQLKWLGQDEGEEGTGRREQAYPWRVRSDETCIHQRELNAALRDIDYQPVAVDCVLGPRTCGASNFVFQRGITNVGIPDTCFAHQREWINPVPVGQAPPPPEPGPVAKKKGSGGVLLILASLVGLAAYGYANS